MASSLDARPGPMEFRLPRLAAELPSSPGGCDRPEPLLVLSDASALPAPIKQPSNSRSVDTNQRAWKRPGSVLWSQRLVAISRRNPICSGSRAVRIAR